MTTCKNDKCAMCHRRTTTIIDTQLRNKGICPTCHRVESILRFNLGTIKCASLLSSNTWHENTIPIKMHDDFDPCTLKELWMACMNEIKLEKWWFSKTQNDILALGFHPVKSMTGRGYWLPGCQRPVLSL